MAGNTARQDRNMPRRLTAITRSHSSTGISSQERRAQHAHQRGIVDRARRSRRSARARPAPWPWWILRSRCRWRDRSPASPARSSASATDFAAAPSMSAATTRAPALANSSDIDLADPLAAAGDDDGASGQIKALVHAGASMDQRRRCTSPDGRGQARRISAMAAEWPTVTLRSRTPTLT